MHKLLLLLTCLFFSGAATSEILSQPASVQQSSWAYDILNILPAENAKPPKSPVIVAVIDDAFRLTHKELKDIIYVNPLEVPGNQLDDDGNNLIDDVSGWDVSDDDADVSVPQGKESDLWHGTYIAGIIARMARMRYGANAGKFIRIMPVKCVPDNFIYTNIKDGYKGIKYASDNGAKIICCAWSGGEPGGNDLKIIHEASQKGVLIIGSSGNFNDEKVLNPANLDEVMAVAGIDSTLKKYDKSNFGMKVDISSPAQYVFGAHPDKDNAYIYESGTSPATAMVSACAAMLISEYPKLSKDELRIAIINSSIPFPAGFPEYGGKLGAGIVNFANALEYIAKPASREKMFSSLRSKGTISISKVSNAKSYAIKPAGAYHGFWLEPRTSNIKNPDKKTITIFIADTLWNKYSLRNYPAKIYVPAQSLRIDVDGKFVGKEYLNISYIGKTIDSTTLYCRDTKYYTEDKQTIEDGSGDADYANNCSCKWIIKAPQGKTIKIIFDRIDTQPNVDFVYIVDGETAIPDNFIAKFSGQNLPPVVYSQTNVVLIWFVTDKTITGQGWKFHYEFVDSK